LRAESTGRRTSLSRLSPPAQRKSRLSGVVTANPRVWRHGFTVDGPRTEAIGGARAFSYVICFPRTEANNARRVLYEYYSRCGRDGHHRSFFLSIYLSFFPSPPLSPHPRKTDKPPPGNGSVSVRSTRSQTI